MLSVPQPVHLAPRRERLSDHALPIQQPVYYISEVLSETKTRYPQIQKLLYAVVLARCKLCHYFEAHPVTVVSSQVMKESSCHDPKMEAYCNAVRRLEDKFDGLELNHIPRKYNKDADCDIPEF